MWNPFEKDQSDTENSRAPVLLTETIQFHCLHLLQRDWAGCCNYWLTIGQCHNVNITMLMHLMRYDESHTKVSRIPCHLNTQLSFSVFGWLNLSNLLKFLVFFSYKYRCRFCTCIDTLAKCLMYQYQLLLVLHIYKYWQQNYLNKFKI